jgi:predicted lipid-binding transport protein (Tim44 family)
MGMNGYMKTAAVGGLAGGLVVGLAFLVVGIGALSGRDYTPALAFTTASQKQPSHGDMHRMMDAVHGEGTSQRMHEAMEPNAEEMMDQCAATMPMMGEMHNMMAGAGPGMMGGQNVYSMRDMMRPVN